MSADLLDLGLASGVLEPADVHVARALGDAIGERDPAVLLGTALAVRAPRMQHVCVDLRSVRGLVADAPDPGAEVSLPWPEPDAWCAALADSALTAVRDPRSLGEPDDGGRACAPLTLAGDRLYLDRLWRDERLVARELRARAVRDVAGVDLAALAGDLEATFLGAAPDRAAPDRAAPDRQRLAAAIAVTRHLAVVAGGPGTGKTTTVARILALLDHQAQAAGRPLPVVGLAAPTGKAAARLTASLREAADRLAGLRGEEAPTAERLRAAEATTLHRLLGVRGDSRSRFRHDRSTPLPHDVVVVDETSMVSLAMIARLLEAVRPDARLVLLGDPEQLASVEAGSVLGDVVGDAAAAPGMHPGTRSTLAGAVGPHHLTGIATRRARGIDDVIVVLDRVHRFRAESGIASVATAIQRGDGEAVVAALRAADDVTWIEEPAGADETAQLRRDVVAVAGGALTAAREGEPARALEILDRLRVLCAHRHGDAGVAGWVRRIERWLVEDVSEADLREHFYLGRPLLVTRNDRRLHVANGDVGIVVRDGTGRPAVALPATDTADPPRLLAPHRLPATQTVHAMTVHKSQGSQFSHVVVVLPDTGSPLLTRELFYTAITRGRERATLIASESAVRAAVGTRAVRASGLATALRD